MKSICRAIWPSRIRRRRTTVPIIRPAPGKKYKDFQLSYALDLLRGQKTVSFITTKSAALDKPARQE